MLDAGQRRFVSFAANAKGRDIAVGDIHGAFSALQQGLDHIGFDPATDRLFAVGDLVDRGPESTQAVEWLDKPWFHAVMGNHEMLTWRAAESLPYPSIAHAEHGGEWLSALPPEQQASIAQRLKALPVVMEISTPKGLVGLVHADCPFDDWVEMRRVAWDGLDDLDELMTTCLWSDARYARKYALPVRNIRAVIHGHMTIPKATVLGNVHFIDTGGGQKWGRFTFLNLHTLKPVRGSGEHFDRASRRHF